MLKGVAGFLFCIGIGLTIIREYIGIRFKWYILLFPFALSLFTFLMSYVFHNIPIGNKVRFVICLLLYTFTVLSSNRIVDKIDLDLDLWICISITGLYLTILFTLNFSQ